MTESACEMPIDPGVLSTLAADYARGMTSIRGRRVQRLLKREFAGAEFVLTVHLGAKGRAVLGLSASGAAWCATDPRGKCASVVKWLHGSSEALESRFDLLKDSLPLLAAAPMPLGGAGGQGPMRIATGAVSPRARALASTALRALA